MKKYFRFFAIAAIALGMTMAVSCKKDEEENGGNGNGGSNTENLPTTLSENFDNSGIPSGWIVIDADGDGDTWMNTIDLLQSGYGHESAGCAMSKSYDNNVGELTPDNYLVSPKIYIDGTKLTWFVAAQDASFPNEHYSVEIGTVNNGTFTSKAVIFEETFSGYSKAQSSWFQRTVDLSAYNGQSVQIAFRHYDCTDNYFLLIDDVKVQ